MTQRARLIQEIISKIDSIPESKLLKILEFLEDNDTLIEEKKTILSFAGKWKNIDNEIFSDLTENLHLRRSSNAREIN